MLGLRQFLKKENGMCPICAIPYVREKRALRASYFDASYDITAWTLRCTECGYEVILPGTARIQAAEKQQGMHPVSPEAEAASYNAATVTITGLDVMEGKKTKTQESMPAGPETDEEAPEGGIIQDEAGTPGSTDSVRETRAPKTADGMGAHLGIEKEGGYIDAVVDAEEPQSGTAGNIPETDVGETGISAAGTWEQILELTDTQDFKKTTRKPANPLPSSPIPDLSAGVKDDRVMKDGLAEDPMPGKQAPDEKPEKTVEPAQKARSRSRSEPMPPGLPAREEKTGSTGQAEKKMMAAIPVEKSEKTDVPPKSSVADKNTAGPERRKKQKGTEPSRQKPQTDAGPAMPQTPAAQPFPKRSQPGTFPGSSIPPGFAGSGIFPSSAFSNLEAVRASIQADTLGKGGKAKEKDRPITEPARNSNTDRPVRTDKGVPINNLPQKPPENINQGNGINQEPDTGTKKQAALADNKKTVKNVQAQKQLSAKSQPAPPQRQGASGASEKLGEKSLSAENKAAPAGNRPVPPVETKEPAETGGNPEASESPKPQREEKGTVRKPEPECRETQNTGEAVKPEAANREPEAAAADGPTEPESNSTGNEETASTGVTPEKGEDGKEEGGKNRKDFGGRAMGAAIKLSDKLPGDLAGKIPVLSQISKNQKHSLFLSEEKKYLEQHIPNKQVIINDLVYDTDNSEMFLRVKGQYGLDYPCVHYNYRTQNGNFFRCTVKYKHEDSIRALDAIEVKRMLEEYPDLYRKFFPDSVSDA